MLWPQTCTLGGTAQKDLVTYQCCDATKSGNGFINLLAYRLRGSISFNVTSTQIGWTNFGVWIPGPPPNLVTPATWRVIAGTYSYTATIDNYLVTAIETPEFPCESLWCSTDQITGSGVVTDGYVTCGPCYFPHPTFGCACSFSCPYQWGWHYSIGGSGQVLTVRSYGQACGGGEMNFSDPDTFSAYKQFRSEVTRHPRGNCRQEAEGGCNQNLQSAAQCSVFGVSLHHSVYENPGCGGLREEDIGDTWLDF